MENEITFGDHTYSLADLQGMSDADLLDLRNDVAKALGVAAVKTFKDHDTAVAQTMKALEKYQSSATTDSKPAKATKPKAEPKERKLAKPAEAQHVKRPTRKHFAKMEMVKPFDGEEDRNHRSANYKDGMLIIDAIEGEGTMRWDIQNWEKQGYCKIVDPTDEEYAERRAAWYKAAGREDPDIAKIKAAEQRKADKEARAAEREAKKAEREAAKAAKAEAAAKAKAEKEAAKAEKAAAAQAAE